MAKCVAKGTVPQLIRYLESRNPLIINESSLSQKNVSLQQAQQKTLSCAYLCLLNISQTWK
jgi:hypothetical protein